MLSFISLRIADVTTDSFLLRLEDGFSTWEHPSDVLLRRYKPPTAKVKYQNVAKRRCDTYFWHRCMQRAKTRQSMSSVHLCSLLSSVRGPGTKGSGVCKCCGDLISSL